MATKKQLGLIYAGIDIFTQIFMKYDVVEKQPIEIARGIKLPSSLIHTIEAIGKGNGKTVTALSEHFKITKGAVSQVITTLCKQDFVSKSKSNGNEKTVLLELTEKGWSAFHSHEQYNQSLMSRMIKVQQKYSDAELQTFLKILTDIDLFFGDVINERN